jgi:glycerol-3-phosphate dehydrogenase
MHTLRCSWRLSETLSRKVLKDIHCRVNNDKLPLLIFVNKGIEQDTQALTLEIIADTCGPEVARVATFLVGPRKLCQTASQNVFDSLAPLLQKKVCAAPISDKKV